MREKPVWLLDVDGVINVDQPSAWGVKSEKAQVEISETERYEMRWAPPLITEIRKIHVGDLAQVMWCSTWCQWASKLEMLWRLPRFDRAFEIHDGYRQMREHKVKAARSVLASGRPLIWTDDDAFPTRPSELSEFRGSDTLLIAPNPIMGLKPQHIATIRAFCLGVQNPED